MKQLKANPVNRIQRIAQTGDIAESKPLTPVENLMEYFPKIPQANANMAANVPNSANSHEGGFWNSVKNFAGTNGGRMLLGGLGSALGVGLTGGNFQDALGYGIIGAGNTADNIYKREQDAKAWQEKEAERLAISQENQANREAQWKMLNTRLDALRADRQAQYDNAVKKLGLEQDVKEQEQLKELEREALRYQQGREWIMNSSLDEDKKNQSLFSYDARHYGVTLPETTTGNSLSEAAGIAKDGYVGLDPEALNRGEVRYITRPQSQSGGVQAFNTMVANGIDPLLAMQRVGWRSIGDEIGLHNKKADIDFNNDVKLEDRKVGNIEHLKMVDEQIADRKAQKEFERDLIRSQYDNELKKDFESYKATLPVPAVVELEQRAKVLQSQGYNVTTADLVIEDFLNKRLSNANIQSQIDERGTTPQIKNAEYLKNNPDMADSSVFKSGTNVNINNGAQTFDKKLSEKRALDYADQESKYRNFVASMPLIEQNVNELMKLASVATYSTIGNIANVARRELGFDATEGAIARAKMDNIIENNVLPQLRQMLGAQFTEREGERVKQTIMDPDRTPEERKVQLMNYLATKKAEMAQSLRYLQSFGNQGLGDYSATNSGNVYDPLGIFGGANK